MGDIVEFKNEDELAEFIEPIKGDIYLEGISREIFSAFGYTKDGLITIRSLKKFQQEMLMDITGKFGINEFFALLLFIDPEARVPIINHLSCYYYSNKIKETTVNNNTIKKELGNFKGILFLLTVVGIFIFGLVEIWIKIISFIWR